MHNIQIAAGVVVILAILVIIAVLLSRFRRPSIITALVVSTWCAYAFYECLTPPGLRYDLIFYIPLLLFITIVGFIASLAAGQKK